MAQERIFLAGAAGAIGARLTPLLVKAGYAVFGTTRDARKAALIEANGAIPVIVDVFDADALRAEMAKVQPDAVVHQLTDLPPGLDKARMAEAVVRNAAIRVKGTRNLVNAALEAGCHRMISQSIAWFYARGAVPFAETAPLDLDPQAPSAMSVGGVVALEALTLQTPDLRGTVLRYGHFYGPGTGFDAPPATPRVHVDAAAHAVLLALQLDSEGVFNIAEPEGDVDTTKATEQLGWRASFRLADASLA
ncbi:MAG: NAD-dependent epimerase/dehydratase family protein [Paraburkholderia sp.]|uniref:NAD-dependent epimerase/dehydratase family protein n=1 Tax=Paraburkholderia sp. TaxID=1926495 RepID=UPI001211AF7D|nr:NAD-dependent epimerase/dehydratase family protein [Paraburkholderia sp.]TAL96684.1 MAG: NAD-dependent epimerase/dehydratase family protein [Paraburkholderia sp.]